MDMSEQIEKGSIVRIRSGGVLAAGPVVSCYYHTIYTDYSASDYEHDNTLIGFKHVGRFIAAIEMYDIMRGSEHDDVAVRNWKVSDHGPHKVEVWEHENPGHWVKVQTHPEQEIDSA